MPGGYWWECEKCGKNVDFNTACKSHGIAHFIQDHLKKYWDQALLVQDCPECKSHTLRIAYEFPGRERQSFRVYNVVGLDRYNGTYSPMMWATKGAPFNGEMIYDFKYIRGRKTFGMNKAAVFKQSELRETFRLFCEKTGTQSFP